MMKSLLLVVDIGNTATSFGLFALTKREKAPSPLAVWTLSTRELRKPSFVRRFLISKLRKSRFPVPHVNGILVSSVVPSVNRSLGTALKRMFGCQPEFVSHRSKSKVKIHYKKPSEVGADRIVDARASYALTQRPAIVIDFGTATTFDCITSGGEYLGGVIAPGPVISAEALYQKTAKLPLVVLEKPASVIGRDTLESIQSGLYHGYRGLVKEVVAQLKKKLGARTVVFATGGQAPWILKGLSLVDRHVPHLTLMGLYHLWLDAHDL